MTGIDDLRSLAERLAESADVRSVYGDPVEVHDRTVIPVARVAYGVGGGYGAGPAGDETRDDGDDGDSDGDGTQGGSEDAAGRGEGAGLGGGVGVTPVGAVEITDDDTRFVRFDRRRRAAGMVLVGLFVGYLLGRRGSE